MSTHHFAIAGARCIECNWTSMPHEDMSQADHRERALRHGREAGHRVRVDQVDSWIYDAPDPRDAETREEEAVP